MELSDTQVWWEWPPKQRRLSGFCGQLVAPAVISECIPPSLTQPRALLRGSIRRGVLTQNFSTSHAPTPPRRPARPGRPRPRPRPVSLRSFGSGVGIKCSCRRFRLSGRPSNPDRCSFVCLPPLAIWSNVNWWTAH